MSLSCLSKMDAQTKAKRVRLTKERKEVMIQHYKTNSNFTQKMLAKWAFETFILPSAPAQSTIVNILKNDMPSDLAPH